MIYYKWQKVSFNHQITHLDPEEDSCYFLMEYTPRVGYKHSEANSRIYNFKAGQQVDSNPARLKHIERCRRQFAKDLKQAIEYLISDQAG